MRTLIDFFKQSIEYKSYFSIKRTWVVTGAAGFIGSHLVENLLLLGQEVRGLDNFSTGRKANIDYLETCSADKAFSFSEGDINDSEFLKNIFDGADFILHQAALGSVPRSIDNPSATHHANVTGYLSVLDQARNSGIKRVVYASSSSVYGDSEILPKVEKVTGKVLSPYAASKMCDEVYADSYVNSYDLELVGLRYFNVFGPRQDPEGPYAAVIPRWIDALANNRQCEIYGDGETSRDFCYIDNVVFANILAAIKENLSSSHMVFNVACGERTTLNDIYRDISGELSRIRGTAPIEPLYRDFRPGDVRHSHADINKISSELGYLPLVFRKKGIEYTVKSFLTV